VKLPGRTREIEREPEAIIAEAEPDTRQDDLDALAHKLHEAEGDLAAAEHDLVVLAGRVAELEAEEVDVMLGAVDAGSHDLAEAELEAEVAATHKRRDRLERVVAGLRSRCAERAKEIGGQAEAEIEDRLAGRGAEIEQHEAQLAALRAEQVDDEHRLAEAREATLASRLPFDDEARRGVLERERRRRETVRSLARMPSWSRVLEHMVPVGMRAEVEAEAARLEAERAARREVVDEQAAQSWQEAGLSIGGTAPRFLEDR
jgi:hypothetical protein